MNITIPKWMQVTALPVLLILLWFAASLITQVLFIFIAAALLAMILNPVVKQLEKIRIPRYVAVFVVYLFFLALIVLFFILIIPPVVNQLQNLVDNLPGYTDTVREQVNSWISSLEGLNLPIDVSSETQKLTDRLETALLDLGSILVAYSVNIVSAITQLFVIIVISIYMLIDSRRISGFIKGFFPHNQQHEAEEFVRRSQSAVTQWVRGQVLLSLLIGLSTGIGIWFLGLIGVWPEGAQYAVFFGAWASLTEFIPYLGPILGALPAVITAMFASPWAALAVIIVFVFIQQVEGHILVPNVMGSVVGVHPLVVIFATLAGAELMGIPGMLIALPLVALSREVISFFRPRISLEKWQQQGADPIDSQAVREVLGEGEKQPGNE